MSRLSLRAAPAVAPTIPLVARGRRVVALDLIGLGRSDKPEHVQFQQRIPGAAGQPHHVIEGANHYIQEDAPDQLSERIAAFISGSAESG